MKRWFGLFFVLCMLSVGAAALGELGFAEVRMDSVNVRDAAGGKMIFKVDAPQSVYVFEEKMKGDTLWCHVCTYRGKNNVDGWIRGDMLRFLSEEFYGVVDVIASNTYAMGLRADGTVAILGDDMPHAPCIDAVRTWTNIREITTRVCSAYGLTDKGVVRAAGLQQNFDGIRASHIGEGYPYPLDSKGRFDYDVWDGVWEDGSGMHRELLGDTPLEKVIGESGTPRCVLTKDGRVLTLGYPFAVRELTADVPYADLAAGDHHAVALRADGRAEVIFCVDGGCAGCEAIGAWTDVAQVEAWGGHVLGRREDGTVCYGGRNEWIASGIAKWRDVVDIAVGYDFCIALFADGHVEMADKHDEGYFR